MILASFEEIPTFTTRWIDIVETNRIQNRHPKRTIEGSTKDSHARSPPRPQTPKDEAEAKFVTLEERMEGIDQNLGRMIEVLGTKRCLSNV